MLHGFRYLLGDTLSEADVRLFPTIFRFDHVYYLRFLLEKAMVVESYPNLQVCYAGKHTACCCCLYDTELHCLQELVNVATAALYVCLVSFCIVA